MALTIDRVLPKLNGVTKSGAGYKALCPAHDDHNPSLSVTSATDGGVLLKCHAGCTYPNIIAALGNNLLRDTSHHNGKLGQEISRYHYPKVNADKIRYYPKNFRWSKKLNGLDPGLYREENIHTSTAIYVVEGEKDVDTLISMGLVAVCSPHGAGQDKWLWEYSQALSGKHVFIIPDNDEIGYQFAEAIQDGVGMCAASVQILDLRSVYPPLAEHGDIGDIFNAVGAFETLEVIEKAKEMPPPRAATKGQTALGSQQENPIIFNELCQFPEDDDLPDFPLEALPLSVREFVSDTAHSVQADIGLTAASVISITEICMQGRYPIAITPDWIEQPCLFIVPIADVSGGKTPVMKCALKPLIRFEELKNDDLDTRTSEYDSTEIVLEDCIKQVRNELSKAKGEQREKLTDELKELRDRQRQTEKPERYRLFGSNVTAEKLATLYEKCNGVWALVDDEGGGIFDNIGAYKDQGELDCYLKGFSGGALRVDRMGRDSVVSNGAILNILAPSQPVVMQKILTNELLVLRGLPARFLVVKCPRVDREPLGSMANMAIAEAYHRLCIDMLSSSSTGNVLFDAGAIEVYEQFYYEITDALGDVDDCEVMKGWGGKAPAHYIRLAGWIHCVSSFERGQDPLSTKISAEEANSAASIMWFFYYHTKSVYCACAEPKHISDAKYLLQRIKSLKSSSIRKRELIRMTQSKKAFELDEALKTLQERGYLHIGNSLKGSAGRPAEVIHINPKIGDLTLEKRMTKMTKLPKTCKKANKVIKVILSPTPDSYNFEDSKSINESINDSTNSGIAASYEEPTQNELDELFPEVN